MKVLSSEMLVFLYHYFWRLVTLRSTELDYVEFLTWLMFAAAVATFVAMQCFNLHPAYGRYSSLALFPKFSIPARIAWTLQEMPSVLFPIIAIVYHYESLTLMRLAVIMLFTIHYFHRFISFMIGISTPTFSTFIYGSLIRGGKPTPVYLFTLGVIFTSWNGYIQGFYHVKYAQYSLDFVSIFRAIIGLMIFVYGMIVNIHSDSILRNLRKPGETGYRIPRGGAFEFVSGANFYGEIVEWVGYAIFAQSWTAWAFALYTMSNTIPRALQHHRWYIAKFEDYPRNRKAVIPFLL